MLTRSSSEWTLDAIEPHPGTSLIAHVEALLPAAGRGPLPNGGEPLPDAPPNDPSKIRWSAGSLDGVLALRGGGSTKGNASSAAAGAVIAALRGKPDRHKIHVAVERLNEVDGPQAMDRLLPAILSERKLDKARLLTFARWICLHEGRRNAVKAGIALLGVCGTPDDAALIERLGLLEELTLYALVALTNVLAQPEKVIFDLAQQVRGWGRIHAIQRLSNTDNPAIQRWLIRGGAENGVMTEEIAFVAATTGHLREALEGDVDDELLDHGGELLRALATGGPSEDMSDYADGAAAMRAFVSRVAVAEPSLDRLDTLTTLERYLGATAAQNPHLSTDEREALGKRIETILQGARWSSLVREKLASQDLAEVKRAIDKCGRFELDAVPVVIGWLRRNPIDDHLWYWLLERAKGVPLDDVLGLAEVLLPLDALANGPEDNLGLGPEYAADNCLGLVVQRLARETEQGWRFIRIALQNRVTRNRNLSLRALKAWPRSSWPSDANELLRSIAWREPEDDVRKRIRELLEAS